MRSQKLLQRLCKFVQTTVDEPLGSHPSSISRVGGRRRKPSMAHAKTHVADQATRFLAGLDDIPWCVLIPEVSRQALKVQLYLCLDATIAKEGPWVFIEIYHVEVFPPGRLQSLQEMDG